MAAVMKSAVRSKFPNLFPGVVWEWFIIDDPYAKVRDLVSEEILRRNIKAVYGSRQVEKGEAMEYIRNHDLVLSYETEDGKIWDTIDGDFKRSFPLDSKTKLTAINDYWEW